MQDLLFHLSNFVCCRLTGEIKQLSTSNVTLNVTQTWGYYTSFNATSDQKREDDTQNSGAYIFRPSTPEQQLHILKAMKARFYHTSVGMEVHVEYEQPWIRTATRILSGLPYVEVEYTVGPIPIDDGIGKEVVTRLFSPDIHNAGKFYTDSNGREFLKRRRNSRPTWDLSVYEPVAGNYYPVNAAIYIEDEKAALTVAVDRSQGGSSILDGSLELMVQRRTLADDSRGVGEAMNETTGGMTPYPPYGKAERVGGGVVIKGKHRILVGNKGGSRLARSVMDGLFAEPLVFVGSSPGDKPVPPIREANITALQGSLPPNVMLVTFSRLYEASPTTFLIRLGHQYAVGEDEDLSKSVDVDLATLLSGYTILYVVEKTLSGNQNMTSWREKRFDWTGSGGSMKGALQGTVVHLNPMEVLTFEVQVAPSF
jgi:hypothetical protein